MHVDKIEKRNNFKIKSGYCLEFLTPETIKILGSTKIVTLTTKDNAKLLQLLKSGFKRAINWNKYHLKTKRLYVPNPYLDSLNDRRFQGVNRPV